MSGKSRKTALIKQDYQTSRSNVPVSKCDETSGGFLDRMRMSEYVSTHFKFLKFVVFSMQLPFQEK